MEDYGGLLRYPGTLRHTEASTQNSHLTTAILDGFLLVKMDFNSEINSLLHQKNYKSIGDKFYLPNSSVRPTRNFQLSNYVTNVNLPSPLDSLSKKYLEMRRILDGQSNSTMTVSSLQPILNSCREFFNETIEYFGMESTSVEQGEWLLRAATSNYIFIGLLISKAGELEVDGDERIGEVFHSIKKCLAQINKKDESKRHVIIFLFSECFKLMFKLKRLGLFPSLLTSVQVLGADKLLNRARKSDSVQFLFYRALYEFHGQKFKEAWERFKETWNLLHPQDWIHRRRVAIYLIAIGLCHGKCPSNEFLIKYKLENDLKGVKESILAGNYKSFKNELNSHSKILHNSLNIYVFLLLNAQPAIHLNLIRRTWNLTGKSKIISFEQIKKVVEFFDLMETSNDELECILITLIGKGWIKGHLGHDSQCLILSASEPFPSILK